MSGLQNPLRWIHSFWIPPDEVRAEIWALGERHRGRVVEGALLEAKAAGISFRRAVLLKAVLRRHAGSAAALSEAAWAKGGA